jgi:hypothetical protein
MRVFVQTQIPLVQIKFLPELLVSTKWHIIFHFLSVYGPTTKRVSKSTSKMIEYDFLSAANPPSLDQNDAALFN